ncbi:MAG: hypothetical protein ACK5QT_04305 [Oligoflexia bacterium]
MSIAAGFADRKWVFCMRGFLVQHRPWVVLSAVAVSALLSSCTPSMEVAGAQGVQQSPEVLSEKSINEPLARCGDEIGRDAAEGQRCVTSKGAILKRVLNPLPGWEVQLSGQAFVSKVFYEELAGDVDYQVAEKWCSEKGLKLPSNEDFGLLFSSFSQQFSNRSKKLTAEGRAEFLALFPQDNRYGLWWSSSEHPAEGRGYGFTASGSRGSASLQSSRYRIDYTRNAMCMLDLAPQNVIQKCAGLPSDLSALEDGARCVTSQGVEFKRVLFPLPGFLMIVPGGKGWFVLSKHAHEPMSLEQAARLCQKHWLSLPSKGDLEKLRSAFAKVGLEGQPVFDDESKHEMTQLFGVNGLFWTAESSNTKVFNSYDGSFVRKHPSEVALVQCVSE